MPLNVRELVSKLELHRHHLRHQDRVAKDEYEIEELHVAFMERVLATISDTVKVMRTIRQRGLEAEVRDTSRGSSRYDKMKRSRYTVHNTNTSRHETKKKSKEKKRNTTFIFPEMSYRKESMSFDKRELGNSYSSALAENSVAILMQPKTPKIQDALVSNSNIYGNLAHSLLDQSQNLLKSAKRTHKQTESNIAMPNKMGHSKKLSLPTSKESFGFSKSGRPEPFSLPKGFVSPTARPPSLKSSIDATLLYAANNIQQTASNPLSTKNKPSLIQRISDVDMERIKNTIPSKDTTDIDNRPAGILSNPVAKKMSLVMQHNSLNRATSPKVFTPPNPDRIMAELKASESAYIHSRMHPTSPQQTRHVGFVSPTRAMHRANRVDTDKLRQKTAHPSDQILHTVESVSSNQPSKHQSRDVVVKEITQSKISQQTNKEQESSSL